MNNKTRNYSKRFFMSVQRPRYSVILGFQNWIFVWNVSEWLWISYARGGFFQFTYFRLFLNVFFLRSLFTKLWNPKKGRVLVLAKLLLYDMKVDIYYMQVYFLLILRPENQNLTPSINDNRNFSCWGWTNQKLNLFYWNGYRFAS